MGLRDQRDRIRKSIACIDPVNSRIQWAASQRTYSVAGPNSLWHIKGHHSLVAWGFVIHGTINGFLHLIVFLKCCTNDSSETVANLFLSATERFHWPSRVQTDYGGENVRVWELMEERRGSNREVILLDHLFKIKKLKDCGGMYSVLLHISSITHFSQ